MGTPNLPLKDFSFIKEFFVYCEDILLQKFSGILFRKLLEIFSEYSYTIMAVLINTIGAWLSLVERFVRDEEVVGSNPVAPIFLCTKPSAFPAKISHLIFYPHQS